jgi:UDP-glucose 4-epimerase
MKIFVTGGTGFIGTHFIQLCLSKGMAVRALRRTTTTLPNDESNEPEWVTGDLETVDPSKLATCDTLVHFAAAGVKPSEATWHECFRWNVSASLRLWLQAVDAGIKKIIICGSCFEYGRSAEQYDFIPADALLQPTGPYHASKAAATLAACALAIEKKIQLTVLRPFHVYGPGEEKTRFWPSLMAAAASGKDFEMSPGEQIRDFTPVASVAQAFYLEVINPSSLPGVPVIKNIGTGIPQSLRNFALAEWRKNSSGGQIKFGALTYRPDEVMRYVPLCT